MTPQKTTHAGYMARAIELARRAWGDTHPNPLVGAVIVEKGEVMAEGWHQCAGSAHAEVEALRALGRKPAEGAILYVTLEPCSTAGRTGACTRAIIEAGIRRVVVGAVDPNPAHAGRGLDVLRSSGVEVTEGILAEECADLNLIFNHWITSQRPFIAAKLALTLDGKFAASSGHSQWVTGGAARADVMRWRRYFPAIAVGANTVLCDDPSLTIRDGDAVSCARRFVFDRQLRTASWNTLPQLYSDDFKSKTTVLCAPSARNLHKKRLDAVGIEMWEIPEKEGHLDWEYFSRKCAGEMICGVYIEAGPTFATSLIERKSVDYLFVYQAPKFIGDSSARGIGSPRSTQSMSEAIELQSVRHSVHGSDVLIRGRLR